MKHRLHLSSVIQKIKCRARLLPALLACCAAVSASDLTIQLQGNPSFTRKVVQYQCDAYGSKIGVPAGAFRVEYINGGGNNLAVVPISGSSLIFVAGVSGSGARYIAHQYIWWEAGGSVTLYSDSLEGKLQSACRVVSGQ